METQKIVNFLNSSEKFQNLQKKKKNGTLLTMNQRVAIHTQVQSNS